NTPGPGRVSVGSTLQLAGATTEYRVRDLEIHGTKSEASKCGRRTAVNLVGSHHRPIRRGDELVAVGSHLPARRFVVSLELAPRTPRLKLPLQAQLHTATRAVACRLLGPKQLDVASLRKGESVTRCVVLVDVEDPIVGTVGQACIVRLPYPVGSIGGGRILASLSDSELASRKTRDLVVFGEALQKATPSETLLAWVKLRGELLPSAEWWTTEAGQLATSLNVAIEDVIQQGVWQIGELLVSSQRIELVESKIQSALSRQAEHEENAWIKIEALVEHCRKLASSGVIQFCLRRMTSGANSSVVELNGLLAIASEQTQLSKKQRARMVDMLRVFEGNQTPPNAKELAAALAISQDATLSLLRHAAQQRVLVELEDGLCMHADVFASYVEQLRAAFAAKAILSVPEIKDLWGVTRKHAIPLLEYCDRAELTARVDEGRVAGASL
ncbi:MAG: SelB C-terminal domain-containing protein, partial [Planctomycetota bacterium]